jgi:hypothetical protein
MSSRQLDATGTKSGSWSRADDVQIGSSSCTHMQSRRDRGGG